MKPTERSARTLPSPMVPLNNSFGLSGLSASLPGRVAYTVNSPSRYSGMRSVVAVRSAGSNVSMPSDSLPPPSQFMSRSNIEK